MDFKSSTTYASLLQANLFDLISSYKKYFIKKSTNIDEEIYSPIITCMNAWLTLPYVHLGETELIDLEIKRSYYRRLAVKSHITYSKEYHH